MTNARFTTVAEAAKFLDGQVEGWANKIDLEKLDMFNSDHCVLGQIYNSAGKGHIKLGLSVEEEYLFGWAKRGYPFETRMPLCKELWTTEINTRLAPKLTPLQQAEITIAELEAKLQEERAKLEALRNPEISVTMTKSQWKFVASFLNGNGYDYPEITKAANGE